MMFFHRSDLMEGTGIPVTIPSWLVLTARVKSLGRGEKNQSHLCQNW